MPQRSLEEDEPLEEMEVTFRPRPLFSPRAAGAGQAGSGSVGSGSGKAARVSGKERAAGQGQSRDEPGCRTYLGFPPLIVTMSLAPHGISGCRVCRLRLGGMRRRVMAQKCMREEKL